MYQGWRSSWSSSVYQSQEMQLNASTAQYCGSHQQFPKDPHQFLHNKGSSYIKLKVSTTFCENKFIVWPEMGH